MKLSPNIIAFIALTNEFCHALESTTELESRDQFVAQMLKLLPRIYISASDIDIDISYSEYEISPYLDEEVYNQVRYNVSRVMEDADVYLEVFEKDMKYSDTPIATTISENLADLYQEFFNFVASIKDADTEVQQELAGLCKENFRNYWSQELCNVLRALNSLYYNGDD